MPCLPSSASTAEPSSAMVYGPGSGWCGPVPWPGSSYRSSRNRPARAGSCGSQTEREVPSELPSTSTGPLPSSEAVRVSRVSDIEEDRLAVTLQADVEAELPRAGGGGYESVPPAP